MEDLPVSHYLNIYEHRLSMSERGIANPEPRVVDGMKILVTALRALKSEERISLDATSERAVFKRSSNGEVIARIDFDGLKP